MDKITHVSGIRGKMRFIRPCGIITSATKLQAGLIPDEPKSAPLNPHRLFFGEHTDAKSYELIEALHKAYPGSNVLTNEYVFTGHLKEENGWLDDRALFVESITPVSD